MCFVLLLGGLLLAPQGVGAAHAAAGAQAQSSSSQAVVSATFILTAVTNSADPNSGRNLALSINSRRGFFYLKNFGTTSLTGFSMTQTRSNSTVRYCVGQEFRSGSATTCVDNSTAILVGTGISLTGRTFTTALPPGGFYAFSSSFTSGSTNTVSVSVSRSNIVTGTSAS